MLCAGGGAFFVPVCLYSLSMEYAASLCLERGADDMATNRILYAAYQMRFVCLYAAVVQHPFGLQCALRLSLQCLCTCLALV